MADPTSFSSLTATLKETLASLPPPDKIQDGERTELLSAIGQLQNALEFPVLSMQRLCFSHYPMVMIRTAIGAGIFDVFVEAGPEGEVTIAELLEKTKGDEAFLKRIMRFLCAHGYFKQTAPETYKALPMALLFTKESVFTAMIKHFHVCSQASVKIPEYFAKNGYRNASDAFDSPFQIAFNITDHYFDWLQRNPEIQEAFNTFMGFTQQHRGANWFEIYPVAERLALSPEDLEPEKDRVLFVDVGGGVGHELIALRRAFPSSALPGRLVLQDLPHVVSTIKEPLPDDASATPHDIFTSQPVIGAKTYYIRTVLHDFPDKQALTALKHIRDAMAPDSVLLIYEHMVPEGPNVPPLAAMLDFHMMETLGSLERTEQQWVELIEKSGFVNVKVHKGTSESIPMALFEAGV
ncbi:S-adenosyl-L-methionine-dependent methyltransferase [Aspergillus stella-maris]|uniref:S-adenosyl-L-methionine-dependent methyltransferase n=1 Tax=Aspergillus stella-maris TaxID=1810926 RepID=UPI003CCE15C4